MEARNTNSKGPKPLLLGTAVVQFTTIAACSWGLVDMTYTDREQTDRPGSSEMGLTGSPPGLSREGSGDDEAPATHTHLRTPQWRSGH